MTVYMIQFSDFSYICTYFCFRSSKLHSKLDICDMYKYKMKETNESPSWILNRKTNDTFFDAAEDFDIVVDWRY